MRKYRPTHPEYMQKAREKQFQMRLRLMDMLGGRICVICGYDKDSRALQIDHINGGGTKEYKPRYGKSSYQMYRIYLKNPKLSKEKLQVLCANCNFIKRWDNDELNHHKVLDR